MALKTEYHIVCRKCGSNFIARLSSFHYCEKCKMRVCKKCGKVWKLKIIADDKKHIFCSNDCSNSYRMKELWTKPDFRKKMEVCAKNGGERLTKNNICETTHPRWKGNSCGYSSLHKWVIKHLGNPKKCEHCGVKGKYQIYFKNGKQFKKWPLHWANKSGKYLRRLSDWLGLCRKCHSNFDNNRKICVQQ